MVSINKLTQEQFDELTRFEIIDNYYRLPNMDRLSMKQWNQAFKRLVKGVKNETNS